MDPKLQGRPNNSKNKAANDEKSAARELWFKTVVKVLKWKEGKGKNSIELITEKEWAAYCKETIKINAGTSKDKTAKKLKDTEELIKKHGGFAN